MTEMSCHSQHWLSGIHLDLFQMSIYNPHAGMTKRELIPAHNCRPGPREKKVVKSFFIEDKIAQNSSSKNLFGKYIFHQNLYSSNNQHQPYSSGNKHRINFRNERQGTLPKTEKGYGSLSFRGGCILLIAEQTEHIIVMRQGKAQMVVTFNLFQVEITDI